MRARPTRFVIALVAILITWEGPLPASAAVRSELVASGLDRPLFATAPAGDARLFVIERDGRIRIVQADGVVVPQSFLDISGQVSTVGEGGLLGLAFAPDFAESGAFYVFYTVPGYDTVLSRFRVGANPGQVDPETEEVLLVVDQPFGNHNGGTVAFGPDGFLFLGLGDGGSSNDPDERSQDPTTLLGKMLRIDVGEPPAPGSVPAANGPYAIPADNPFLGAPGVLDEIWAFGVRNPYRFSFDRDTGDLWIADVGQGQREEIDFEAADDPGGRNYGWDVMEGSLCNGNDPAPAPPCNDPSLTLPVHEYAHTSGNCSITGGFVERNALGGLPGHYYYGDFCTGRIWTYDPVTDLATDRSSDLGGAALDAFELVGFGEDAAGRLYVVHQDGDLYRIRATPACSNGTDDDGDGNADYPADLGCRDAESETESPACQDGLDNDSATGIDFDGGASLDLDEDGFIDAAFNPATPAVGPADPQCIGKPWKNVERKSGCGLGFELALVLSALWGLRRYGLRAGAVTPPLIRRQGGSQ